MRTTTTTGGLGCRRKHRFTPAVDERLGAFFSGGSEHRPPGGIINLALSKSHPDHQIPRHVRWLLPYLLGKYRVPLYFFYGQDFPLTEPIPDALVSVGFVPSEDEVRYLRSLPSEVTFSPWFVKQAVWTRCRNGAPPSTASSVSSASSSSHAPPTYRHSQMPADSSVPAITSPPVESDSKFTPNQRIYDSFSNQWDLCTALAPNEEAEPDAYDNDDDFQFHQPSSSAELFPSIPDVPGRETMEGETGESATQVLEQAYDLDREGLAEDVDNPPGWRIQDVSSTISLGFGFDDLASTISSSTQTQDKSWSWAIGDSTWVVPETSALPTLLEHILGGDLKAIPPNLCDLTSPDSDLELDWNVNVKIFRQWEKTLYEIRSRGSEASSPSILLESTATVLQIIRSGWGHGSDVESIIRNLVELGVEFHPSWQRPAHHVPFAPPSQSTLGCRPPGYTPTLVDFGVYVWRRDTFLRSSCGRCEGDCSVALENEVPKVTCSPSGGFFV
ncbi:hypothetical protein C8J57DRAFT_1536850 [Mycena rebaudengoi]|nr:hypothetical protein C8J57DRAFT_1536850 [Mycena rebaudengoi]